MAALKSILTVVLIENIVVLISYNAGPCQQGHKKRTKLNNKAVLRDFVKATRNRKTNKFCRMWTIMAEYAFCLCSQYLVPYAEEALRNWNIKQIMRTLENVDIYQYILTVLVIFSTISGVIWPLEYSCKSQR